jgi:HTH-type transcriptional regulator, sugar sensing transcriptional regulator
MKKKSFIKYLVDYGLSEKEASVYLTLLELQMAPVQEITRKTHINRSTVYVILDNLIEKGLVFTSDKAGVQQFISSSPEILAQKAREVSVRHDEIKKKIDNIIPELKGLYKGVKTKPIIKVFEGVEGLTTVFSDSFNVQEKIIRVYSSHLNLFKSFPKDFLKTLENYICERKKKNIKIRSIHPDSKVGRKVLIPTMSDKDEWVLIPEKDFKSTADLAIYDDKISYMTHKNNGLGIIIESKEIADVMKNLFDLAHKRSKEISTLKSDSA